MNNRPPSRPHRERTFSLQRRVLSLLAVFLLEPASAQTLRTIDDFDYDFDNNGGFTFPLKQSFKGIDDVTFSFLPGDPGGNENGTFQADFSGVAAHPTHLRDTIRFFEFTPHNLTAEFAMDFAIPLEVGDLLLFLDFDLLEEGVSLRAFSPAGVEIEDLSDWQFNEYPGLTGVADNTTQWDPVNARISTVPATAGNVLLPLATLVVGEQVGRLEYKMSYANGGGTSFQVGTLVPEPSTALLLSLLSPAILRRKRCKHS